MGLDDLLIKTLVWLIVLFTLGSIGEYYRERSSAEMSDLSQYQSSQKTVFTHQNHKLKCFNSRGYAVPCWVL